MAINERARRYLFKFGYLVDNARGQFSNLDSVSENQLPDDLQAAISEFQRMAGIPETGEWDQATESASQRPRCGCPDVGPRTALGGSIEAKFVAFGTRWNRAIITYCFENTTNDLSKNVQETVIRDAFAQWADIVPLIFREVDAGSADIRIQFGTGDHGDGSPFDGKGSTLAHAFFPPPNAGDLAGDIHYDDSETWGTHVHTQGEIDLFTVSVHEIGHSLGLRHTCVPNSTMNPCYPTPSTPQADDRVGIQSIYSQHIWVASLYRDILDRQFDDQGLDYWVRELFTGSSEIGVANGFVRSKEKARQLASELYRWLLDRGPDQGGLDHWTDRLQGVLSREAVIVAFLASAEFEGLHSNNQAFVDAVYKKLLSRHPDPEGCQYWLNRLASGMSRRELAMHFLRSDEYTHRHVTNVYKRVLRRDPDQEGLNYWTNQLKSGQEDHQSLLARFVTSQEYRDRVVTWWS